MITEEILDLLRIKVKSYVNERTYSHILGVEREAASLADIYLPEGERKTVAILPRIWYNTRCRSAFAEALSFKDGGGAYRKRLSRVC